jgi:hypothetical protein
MIHGVPIFGDDRSAVQLALVPAQSVLATHAPATSQTLRENVLAGFGCPLLLIRIALVEEQDRLQVAVARMDQVR